MKSCRLLHANTKSFKKVLKLIVAWKPSLELFVIINYFKVACLLFAVRVISYCIDMATFVESAYVIEHMSCPLVLAKEVETG